MTKENPLMIEKQPETFVSLPVLPLKNTVLFPHLFMPLSVGRPVSMAAVEAVLATEDKTLLAVARKNAEVEQPTADDLYTVGTRAVVKKMARCGSGDRAAGAGCRARCRWFAWSRPSLISSARSPVAAARRRGPRWRRCTAPCST